MKTELSTRQKELLGIVIHNVDHENLAIDLGLIMLNFRDRLPFVDRKKNNIRGEKHDQRRNGVVQAVRFLGLKLMARGVKFERRSKLGRGNSAIYGFKSFGDFEKAREILRRETE